MSYNREYFYIPEENSFSVITQYVPSNTWNSPRYVMYLTNLETTIEIDFSSEKGIQVLTEALEKLQTKKSTDPHSIQTCVVNLD